MIIGGGGHGLATAYDLAREFDIINLAVIENVRIGGLNFNGGGCFGGCKATPATGFCYAHLIATDRSHETAGHFRLDRFQRDAPIDEKGMGAQPNLHYGGKSCTDAIPT